MSQIKNFKKKFKNMLNWKLKQIKSYQICRYSKAVLIGKYYSIEYIYYNRKEESSKINHLSIHIKKLEK